MKNTLKEVAETLKDLVVVAGLVALMGVIVVSCMKIRLAEMRLTVGATLAAENDKPASIVSGDMPNETREGTRILMAATNSADYYLSAIPEIKAVPIQSRDVAVLTVRVNYTTAEGTGIARTYDFGFRSEELRAANNWCALSHRARHNKRNFFFYGREGEANLTINIDGDSSVDIRYLLSCELYERFGRKTLMADIIAIFPEEFLTEKEYYENEVQRICLVTAKDVDKAYRFIDIDANQWLTDEEWAAFWGDDSLQ